MLIADDEQLARTAARAPARGARRTSRWPASAEDGEEVLARVRARRRRRGAARHPDAGPDAAWRRWRCCPTDGPVRDLLHRARRSTRCDAFDAGAVDYLLKPIEAAAAAEGARARARARGACGGSRPSARRQARAARPPRRGCRSRRGRASCWSTRRRSRHAVLEGELVTVFTRAGRATSPTSRCRSCEERLAADGFERVHRRALLNLAHVSRLEPLETGGYIARTAGRDASRCRGRRRASCAGGWACAKLQRTTNRSW